MASADALTDVSTAFAPFQFWTPKRRRWYSILAGLAVVWGGYNAVAGWRDRHAFLINATESLPYWAFLIERGRVPGKGQLVSFDPPRTPLVLRHFGRRPPMFNKYVWGVGGDSVTRVNRTFFVNGVKVAVAKPVSRLGEPLALGPVGKIPIGCMFVGTPHKDGFDSRYAQIGWICRNRVIGTATPIL
ncbi:S26 family signal peptidase [Sphingomonas sp. BIUV-7]|uniref:S26 family signal peptidase n=1 Tax=Sphingomonas natans TaxID=3063330 RepID=A0ABT8Y7X4_9SPHN|nr:S26 family signal peptidase [Sphingomonas sp. BIUV-7]MDO6414409.1 S26 family signal peptidase [Sphingomonas sp. BIUV-7]